MNINEKNQELVKDAYLLRGKAHERTGDATDSIWTPVELVVLAIENFAETVEIKLNKTKELKIRKAQEKIDKGFGPEL